MTGTTDGGGDSVTTGGAAMSTTHGDATAVTSSGVSGSSGSSGSSGDGSTFIVSMDGGACNLDCDVWAQDCCHGERCTPWADNGGSVWNAVKCVPPARDPAHAGEPCTVAGSGASGIDSCDLESLCWDVDEVSLTGVCVPMCDGSPEDPICPEGTSCVIANDGVITLCLPSCNPLIVDCQGDELCVPNPNGGEGFVCTPDVSGPEGQVFDPCEYVNSCDQGLQCARPELASECDPEASGCCLPYCDTTLPGTCPGALQTCIPAYAMGTAPPGLENVGVCGLMP